MPTGYNTAKERGTGGTSAASVVDRGARVEFLVCALTSPEEAGFASTIQTCGSPTLPDFCHHLHCAHDGRSEQW